MDPMWRYERYDPDELAEKMMTAIVLGVVSMEESGLVRTDEDRALWRRMARSVKNTLALGAELTYSVDDDDAEDE